MKWHIAKLVVFSVACPSSEFFLFSLCCFEFGAKTVTIASAAANYPERFAQFILSYGREKINLAADTNPSDHKIKIRGWLKKTEIDLFDHIEFFYEKGNFFTLKRFFV